MNNPFSMGRKSGLVGNTLERNIMCLGLSMAADAETVRNTREWLRGFDQGLAEYINPKPPQPDAWDGHKRVA